MRSIEQINFIKQEQSPPKQILNLVNEKKINFLLDYYNNSTDIIIKNTGPKVLKVNPGEGIIDDIIENLKSVIGNFEVRAAHFFDVSRPHIIHNDDDKSLPKSYKAITLPLYINGDNIPELIFFDQYYYQGPVKCVKNSNKDMPIYYNNLLKEYSEIENLNNKGIPEDIKTNLLTHLKDEWLEGFSIHSYFPWIIGSGIIFDSLQLHCASDFTSKNITQKIGLSIFTVK